jgi:hypothetical protein
MFHAWKQELNDTQRSAWATAAHSIPILDNTGKLKTPTGFELFIWWQSYQPTWTWNPPNQLHYSPGNYDPLPPSPSLPRPTPTGIELLSKTAPNLELHFQSTNNISYLSAFLQLTDANLPGANPLTSHWKRLTPAVILPYTPPPFRDTFTGTAPVPPWTATPTYNPANWPEAGNLLSPNATGPCQSIRAGLNATNYTISCYTRLHAGQHTYPSLSWGINPSTGARSGWLWNNDTAQISIATYTSWTSAPTILHSWTVTLYPYPGAFTLTEVLVNGNQTTLLLASTPYGPITTGPQSGDTGIDSQNGLIDYSAYSCQPAQDGYTATLNYRGIIENPANPGPRAARLTLGDGSGSFIHSLWVPFTLDT